MAEEGTERRTIPSRFFFSIVGVTARETKKFGYLAVVALDTLSLPLFWISWPSNSYLGGRAPSLIVLLSLCVMYPSSSICTSCLVSSLPPPALFIVLVMGPLCWLLIFEPHDEISRVRTHNKTEEWNNCNSCCLTVKYFKRDAEIGLHNTKLNSFNRPHLNDNRLRLVASLSRQRSYLLSLQHALYGPVTLDRDSTELPQRWKFLRESRKCRNMPIFKIFFTSLRWRCCNILTVTVAFIIWIARGVLPVPTEFSHSRSSHGALKAC